MVADGVHILFSLALVRVLFRSRRPEPYLVAALAATFPDVDIYLFTPLIRLGYVDGVVWVHRGVTHSLLAGVLVTLALSRFGPWQAAAAGFYSHVAFDLLTGGVRLFAPVDPALYGFSLSWLLLNVLTSALAVSAILGGLYRMSYEHDYRPSLSRIVSWFAGRFQ